MLKVLDLFAGIGGFTLGLENTGAYETIGFVECGSYQQKVLKKHWPHIPIHSDIRSIKGFDFNVDVITGGFPCQPFSTAAHGHHTAIDFWPEMLRVIKEARPTYVIAENVVKKAIVKAQKDIEELGYETTIIKISAADCGAPHQRTRWWLCAYPNMHGQLSSTFNAETQKLQKLCQDVWGSKNLTRAFRISNGISNRMDRIRCLGNTVVPYIPQLLGNVLANLERDGEY